MKSGGGFLFFFFFFFVFFELLEGSGVKLSKTRKSPPASMFVVGDDGRESLSDE